jgi:hypothetical protein
MEGEILTSSVVHCHPEVQYNPSMHEECSSPSLIVGFLSVYCWLFASQSCVLSIAAKVMVKVHAANMPLITSCHVYVMEDAVLGHAFLRA